MAFFLDNSEINKLPLHERELIEKHLTNMNLLGGLEHYDHTGYLNTSESKMNSPLDAKIFIHQDMLSNRSVSENMLEINPTNATKQLSFADHDIRRLLMEEYNQKILNPTSGHGLSRLFDCVDKHAHERPNELAIREYNTGEDITWSQLQLSTRAIAAKLLSLGTFKKGDIVVTHLPLLKEHLYFMFACWRLGLIVVPLDLRLKDCEICSSLETILGITPNNSKGNGKVKMFVFLGKTPTHDFRPIIAQVMDRFVGKIPHWIQFQKDKEFIMPRAVGVSDFLSDAKSVYIMNRIKELSLGLILPSSIVTTVSSMESQCSRRTPCLIIFTTGSVGKSKAAILCHEGILMQNLATKIAFTGVFPNPHKLVNLCNLPPSHVGCLTEQVLTAIYGGGQLVLIHVFDPEKSLDAVQKYKCNLIGQIPALFSMEWALPTFKSYDLSSLGMAIYGGQAVTKPFLHKMQGMAPYIGSGLGLTETAGFCTYTPIGISVDQMSLSIGFDAPFCPITIRYPPRKVTCPRTGKIYLIAGEEKRPGEFGEICHAGPQIFLGYLNDTKTTSETIVPTDIDTAAKLDYSKILNYDPIDGFLNGTNSSGIVNQTHPINYYNLVLYTGDIGSYDSTGLHFASRRKFIIKQKGYQVYPGDVEEHLEQHFKLLGAPHSLKTGRLWELVKSRFEEQEDENVVLRVGVVGVEHEIYSEAVVAVVELNKYLVELAKQHSTDSERWFDLILNEKEIIEACKDIAAYKRPTYVFFLPPGMDMPLNRTAKIDYLALQDFAKKQVALLEQKKKPRYSSL